MGCILSVSLFLLADTAAGYLVPKPPGRYNVTLTNGPLIDYTRKDPYAATPIPRALMLSVFQPAMCASTVAALYMPKKTAEYQGPYLQTNFNVSTDFSPLFLDARLPVCSDSCSPPKDTPILLFSPGYGVPRLYYSVLASAVASEGFTVITIDHPEDANIITYPDGHAVYNNETTNDTVDDVIRDLDVRAADFSFVIDQLRNASAIAALLPHRGPRPFPTDRVAIFGHSVGGDAALVAAARDSRLRAAINWDGPIYGSLPPQGISQPALFMASETGEQASEWRANWSLLKGQKLWVTVEGSTHQTFTDVPTLLRAAGVDAKPYEELLGTIMPARMTEILAAYTAAWMDGAFKGKEGGSLMEGKGFPEVKTVMGNL